VPPVLAVTYFEKRYNNDPLLLQYAHRVLEQHPVELTFFFVPQIVQALRYDELGNEFKHRSERLLSVSRRLCYPLHLRNRQDLPAFLSSNHMEYEGKLLQRRRG
jgi:hypothetical protein